MNIYMIHAMENMYHGLHGIEDVRILEAENKDELESLGREMSIEVMKSYDDVGETLLENARDEAEFNEIDEDSAEFENILDEQYEENVEYYIYQLSNEFTVEQYESMLDIAGAEGLLKYEVK